MLPIAEVLDTLAKDAFAPLNGRALYARNGVAQLQAYFRQFPEYEDLTVRPSDLAIVRTMRNTPRPGNGMPFKAIVPDGDVRLRSHKLVHKRLPDAPSLILHALRVTLRVGPFVLQREIRCA